MPTLSVYRNQQGVFLPTMTSNEGTSFWRILKTSKSPTDGDPIQDGEVVRLSWQFKDQCAYLILAEDDFLCSI
jgi:hypothetical protein